MKLRVERDGYEIRLRPTFQTMEEAEAYVLANDDLFEGFDWVLTDDKGEEYTYISSWE